MTPLTKARIVASKKEMDLTDTYFSRALRLMGANDQGVCFCATCGIPREVKKIQCGHFMTRNHKATRWEFKNCAPQCGACNGNKGGEQFRMGEYLDKKYGEGTAQMMRIKSKNFWKVHPAELELLRKEFLEIIKVHSKRTGVSF